MILDPVVKLVTVGQLDQLVNLDNLDQLDHLAHQVLLVQEVIPDQWEEQVVLEELVPKETEEKGVHQVHLVNQDQLDQGVI